MSSQDDRDTESSTGASSFNKELFSGFDIDKYAKLANLSLTDEEKDLYSEQLLRIIGYCVGKLNQISASDTNPTFNVTGQSNVMREDETTPSLSQEEALLNAPKKKEGMFETKGVFDE